MLGEIGMPRKEMEALVIFGSLLFGANKKEFDFSRIHSKTIQAETGVYDIKSGS